MSRGWAVLLCVLCACGRIGFDEQAGDGPDGSVEEGAPDDFFDLGQFSSPEPLDAVSDPSGNDCHPSLTVDGLELVFTSTRFGDNELFVATRADVGSPFGAPRLLEELKSGGRQTTPALSADGLTMWFASDRAGGLGGLDIYVTQRASRADPWQAPMNLASVNSAEDDHSPMVTADGLTLVMTRRTADAKRDLFLAERTTADVSWPEPRAIDEVNTPDQDADAYIDASGRFLLLNSDRNGNGFRDIFVSTRTESGEFGPAVEIPELNTERSDADPWLSADYRQIVFSSSRDGSDDLYFAKR